MTRGFTFKLVDPTAYYRLWEDIIALGADPTFSNTPYIADMVSELQIYFPILGPNSLNNAGNNFSIIDRVNNFEMSNQISDGLFRVSLSNNAIPLKNFLVKGSAANVQIEITITWL